MNLPIVIGQNVYFDYLYVNDLVRITEYFLNHDGKYPDYNAVSGDRVDLLKITKTINDVSQFKSEIIIRNKGLNLEYTADNSRLMGEIPGFRFTEIEKGIRELYGWYRIHLKEFEAEKIREDKYLKYLKIKNQKQV